MLFCKCSDTRAFIVFLLFVVVFFCACQSVQSVFRSLATLEKTVEKCHIELNEQKDRLTFTLHCKHGNSALLHPVTQQSSIHRIYLNRLLLLSFFP